MRLKKHGGNTNKTILLTRPILNQSHKVELPFFVQTHFWIGKYSVRTYRYLLSATGNAGYYADNKESVQVC